jgi:predicted MFS family arabinose efflux permease
MSKPQKDLSSFALSLALLVLSALFSMAINIGSFRQAYSSGVMSSYAIPGTTASRLIEQGLRFGKPLDDFYGIERYLKSVQTTLPDVVHVEVASFEGRFLADENGPIKRQMPATELIRLQRELAKKPQTFVHDNASQLYRLIIALRPESTSDPVGFVVVSVKDAGVDRVVSSFADSLFLRVLLIIGLISGMLLLLWRMAQSNDFVHRRYRTLSLAVVALAQVVCGYFGYVQFHDEYLASTRETTTLVAHILESTFNSLVQRGVHYDQLSGVNEYLVEVQKTAPFLSLIRVEPAEAANALALTDELLRSPLPPDSKGGSWTLVMSISKGVLHDRLQDILLDAGAILVTSLMFMFELSLAVIKRPEAQGINLLPSLLTDLKLRVGGRFSAFLMYFGMFMSASFVPLVMSSFGVPLPGISLGQSAAAAISAEMAAGSLALLLSNTMSVRLGAVRLAYVGHLFLILAALLAWLAPNPELFLLARAMTGIGSMWVLVSLYRMVNSIRDDEQRQAAVPEILAGSFAGANCGVVTGSFLSAQIGPQAVFAAAALVLLASLVYVWQTSAKEMHKNQAAVVKPPNVVASKASRRDYLGLALFFLLVSAPTAAISMYLPYFFPVFAADMGAGPNVIGRGFLINGMCFVFLGPWLAGWARRTLRPAWSVAMSAGLLILGLIVFGSAPQLATAFLAVALMSLGDCFGISSQVAFVTSLPMGVRLGRAVVQDLQLNARKMGQAIGPLIFSLVAAYGGTGLGGLGALMGAFVALFLLLSALPLLRTGPSA